MGASYQHWGATRPKSKQLTYLFINIEVNTTPDGTFYTVHLIIKISYLNGSLVKG